jgi:hypothetical protein
MAFPWSHWPDASLQSINAGETPEERTRRQQETDAKLHDVVKVSSSTKNRRYGNLLTDAMVLAIRRARFERRESICRACRAGNHQDLCPTSVRRRSHCYMITNSCMLQFPSENDHLLSHPTTLARLPLQHKSPRHPHPPPPRETPPSSSILPSNQPPLRTRHRTRQHQHTR